MPESVDLPLAVRASCYLELFALDRPGVCGSGLISAQSLPEYLDEDAEFRGIGIDICWLPISSGTDAASAGWRSEPSSSKTPERAAERRETEEWDVKGGDPGGDGVFPV